MAAHSPRLTAYGFFLWAIVMSCSCGVKPGCNVNPSRGGRPGGAKVNTLCQCQAQGLLEAVKVISEATACRRDPPDTLPVARRLAHNTKLDSQIPPADLLFVFEWAHFTSVTRAQFIVSH